MNFKGVSLRVKEPDEWPVGLRIHVTEHENGDLEIEAAATMEDANAFVADHHDDQKGLLVTIKPRVN